MLFYVLWFLMLLEFMCISAYEHRVGKKLELTRWFIDSYLSIILMLNVFRLYKT